MTDRNTKAELAETITIDELVVTVVRSARRKSLSLEVDSDGAKARAPERMRRSTIEKFIQGKYQWLKYHYEHRPTPLEPLNLTNGTVLKLLDEDYTLRIDLQESGSVKITSDSIYIPLAAAKTDTKTALKNKLHRWYKQQSRTYLQDKVMFFADEMQIPLSKNIKIKVRDYKRRWGSCSHKGDLTFNWRIIMAPEEVVDYVAIHEIAHLIEFNHSKRFWNIVSAQCPQWKQQRDWLNQHGSNLYRF